MKILSIIIPVFNTEKYLTRCIQSCIQSCIDQDTDTSDYEIIVVNDGSTDNSLQIAQNFEKEYTNIKVVSQINQKQGAARNNGLKIALGEYIWFVDSDDWIEPYAVKKILEYLENNGVEILRFDAVDHKSNNKEVRLCHQKPNYTYSRHEVLYDKDFSVCVPFHVFKRSFLLENKLFFIENIFFEDNEYMLRVIEKADSFVYLKEHFYNVLFREGSTTRSVDYNRYLDLLIVINAQLKYLQTNVFDIKVEKVFSVHISRNMNSLLVGTVHSSKIFHIACESLLSIKDLWKYTKISGSSFHKIEYHLLRFPIFLKRILLLYYFKKV